MNKRNMTEGAPWRHILRFAVPVLLGSVLQQLYSTVDTVIVGKCLGEAALSAVGTTGSFSFLLLAVALGFSAGNGVVVAQYYGAGDEKNVRAAASVGILFLFGLGAAAALLGVAVARPAYTWLINVPADFLPQTITYFRIYALGLVFQYGYNIFSSILRAVGDSRATLLFLLISSVLNILLDLLFVAVFSWGGGRRSRRNGDFAGGFLRCGRFLYETQVSGVPVPFSRLSLERSSCRADRKDRFPHCGADDRRFAGHDPDPAGSQRLRPGDDRVLHRRSADRNLSESAL